MASYTFGCVKMSDFVLNNPHLREVLIFFFHSKKTAAEAHRELQKVYEDAALSETTCRDWFRRFKDGDFNVDDRPREGRPKTFEDADYFAKKYDQMFVHKFVRKYVLFMTKTFYFIFNVTMRDVQ